MSLRGSRKVSWVSQLGGENVEGLMTVVEKVKGD